MFSITAYHCKVLERVFFHLGMPATTVTYGQNLANTVNVLVKKFGVEKKSESPAIGVQTWQSARPYLEIQ